jgi:hypothetical protein
MNNTSDVYEFVEQLKSACQSARQTELLEKLNDALNLGSSGLEILGAIREIIIKNRKTIQSLLDSTKQVQIDEVISFVDRAYGRIR